MVTVKSSLMTFAAVKLHGFKSSHYTLYKCFNIQFSSVNQFSNVEIDSKMVSIVSMSAQVKNAKFIWRVRVCMYVCMYV